VIALAEAGQIKDSVTQVRFEDVNDTSTRWPAAISSDAP
jgi:hypothetical protein